MCNFKGGMMTSHLLPQPERSGRSVMVVLYVCGTTMNDRRVRSFRSEQTHQRKLHTRVTSESEQLLAGLFSVHIVRLCSSTYIMHSFLCLCL
jgi:hypothetical protein